MVYQHGPLVKWSKTLASHASNMGSNPVRVTKKFRSLLRTEFFYPSRRLGISSRDSVYIIAAGVYHHAKRVCLRLDEIQHFVLMIYHSSRNG